MDRSPRSAGVRPRAAASMQQYHTLRSFVITLAIAIAVTTSPASGFTIRRTHNNFGSTPDLETGESTQLEVKYDLKTLSGNKTNDNSKNKGELDPTVIAIGAPKVSDASNKTNESITVAPITVNETSDVPKQISEDKTPEIIYETPTLLSANTIRNTITTSAPSTSQTTTREPEKGQELSTKSTLLTSVATESQITAFTESSNNNVETKSERKQIDTNGTKTSEIQNITTATPVSKTTTISEYHKGEIDSIEKNDTSTLNYTTSTTLNYSDANKNLNITKYNVTTEINLLRKAVDRPIFETDLINLNKTAAAEMTNNSINMKGEKWDVSLNRSLNAATTTELTTVTDVTQVTFEVTTSEITTQTVNTETDTIEFNPPTVPSWKKYTTIDRKRTSTEDTTTTDKDMAPAETGQGRIILEKVLSETPIPSLEKLRNDLINAQESTTMNSNFETTGNYVETTTNTQLMDIKNETEITKLEIVSKRAGYKDNRETTTPKPKEATTSTFAPRVTANDTPEMFSSMYETEANDVEVLDNKNVTVHESQSQLAEDAIKEELLKEETLNDEENFKRYHEDGMPKATSSKPSTEADLNIMMQEVVTEDTLSVKPISQEKKKNTILYAVSPNYKPLKKIDVQPPKIFIRDPDDNSWRNESISSLGIVFKPKNASKSFTQVLKNKTETELANMTEKDSRGDVPDLRVRLEKIAEVRKSKKKTINKFGDTVYSDYEESGENANSSKDETTSPMSPPSEPSPFSTPDYDLTVNAISKEKLDFFKHTITTPISTDKPKKFYNLAEYYDSTDEYDADYVNIHKIDLKKFTQPIKMKDNSPTQPPELLRTKPMKEYQPERVATVQYFPPTQKVTQKVNLNEYDADFNRKLNLYTVKEPPKSIAPSYATVPPIQSENYEQLNKLTVKPVYTPIYRTELDKNLYLTNQPRVSEPPSGFAPNDGNFNRASYVIKHYRDFINEAVKEGEDERSAEYPGYTQSPIRGVTVNDLARAPPKDLVDDDYEYDMKFRKDIINKFVDNFNQNSERFKVDFPILYNSSVVHSQMPESGKAASSSAFLKRLYETGQARPSSFLSGRKPCDPHCDNMTVELSPAYELHYYVPDQEEKEEIEPRPITVPYRYRL